MTNLKFQHKLEYLIFQKSSYKNRAKQNPFSYYILYNESQHNILARVYKANKQESQKKTHHLHTIVAL